MNPIISDDLSPAEALLREGLYKNKVICVGTSSLCIPCGAEWAFSVSLHLEKLSGSLPQESTWTSFALQKRRLWVKTEEGEHELLFSQAQCEIRLRDYANAPALFAPHHYIRDTLGFLLRALSEKNRLLSRHLSREEAFFLPLCETDLFHEPAPSKEIRELLAPFGIKKFPLQEDALTLGLLRTLQQRLSLPHGGEDSDPTLLLEHSFGGKSFSFSPKKPFFSVGLRTYLSFQKPLFCHLHARRFEDRILLECAISTAKQLSSPVDCTARPKDRHSFFVYSLSEQEYTEETLLRFQKEITEFSPSSLPSLRLPSHVNGAAVFLLSSLLWALLSAATAKLFLLPFPSLAFLAPWAPLPALCYGGIRWLLYALSDKI